MSRETVTVGEAVRRRIRELREKRGQTQDEVVRGLRKLGLDWSRSHLAKIEAGTTPLDRLPDLLVVADSFGISLADLLGAKDAAAALISLNDVAAVEGSEAAEKLDVRVRVTWSEDAAAAALEADARGDAEIKAARRLGVDSLDVATAALRTFRRSLTDEREERVSQRARKGASDRTRQAIRGHVTRELVEELRPVVEKARRRRARGGPKK